MTDIRSAVSNLVALPIIGIAAACMVGCSRGPARGAIVPPARTESLCDRKLLTLADAAGILRAPLVELQPVPGDAQSCEFRTAGFSAIIVSLRPGRGRAELAAWVTGKMSLAVEPLPGVGESAVWQQSLRRAIAQQNNLLCEIQVRGEGEDIGVSPGDLARATGALCNRMFAAY